MGVKIGKSKNGYALHYSVGAIIKRADKYLLIDRVNAPYGFACVAGHVEDHESAEESLVHQVKEESGMEILKHKLLFEEEYDGNWCSRGIGIHYWHVFECETEGEPELFLDEAKSIGWFTPQEMKKINLEPMWQYWFKKIGVI